MAWEIGSRLASSGTASIAWYSSATDAAPVDLPGLRCAGEGVQLDGLPSGVLRRRHFHRRVQQEPPAGPRLRLERRGILLGGLSEQLSLVTGFNYLIFVAIAFYLLSLALRPRAV